VIVPLLAQTVWQRFLEYQFYQNALAGGVAIALLCSVLSVFVVLKRVAFAGQGISHAAFGGAGLALLLELFLPPLRMPILRDAVIAVFCVATALVIGRIARQRRLGEDSAIGICLVAAMALGVVFLNLRAALFKALIQSGQLDRDAVGYTPSFHDLLFGNILSIPIVQVWATWIIAVLLLAGLFAMYKEFVFFAFDEEAAGVFGLPTGRLYYGMLAALGITIVLAMRLLGVILASALLILPGACALLWSRRLTRVLTLSVVIGVGSVAGGLVLAMWISARPIAWSASTEFYVDLSVGPVIVLLLCLVLGISWPIVWARSKLRQRRAR
jgi:zinc transport system permease protein